MKAEDIRSVSLPRQQQRASVCLMDQEIAGTKVLCHTLPAGQTLEFLPCEDFARIVFVCSGEVTADSPSGSKRFSGRGVYVGKVSETVTFSAGQDAQLMELCHSLNEAEFTQVLNNPSLPYGLNYDDAARYTEDCKSPKTVSRMLIPQRLIPRFAMGSVETYGVDRIEKHTHPMLEQFFFGLEENNCLALIDDLQYPFTGNMLLHIPLGSDHGIHLDARHVCHYLWMDFLLDEDALQYMDEAHTIIP